MEKTGITKKMAKESFGMEVMRLLERMGISIGFIGMIQRGRLQRVGVMIILLENLKLLESRITFSLV
jgi:hypothetical protein